MFNAFQKTVRPMLQHINLKTAALTLVECQKSPLKSNQLLKYDAFSKAKSITFSPRSIGLEINDKPGENKIKQDPGSYIPIVNPRSILPLIEEWRKDEIALPTPEREEKLAIRLLVIRRKKMKKHQRRKLYKKMKFVWAKLKKNRRNKKERLFQYRLVMMVKKANSFSPENYVEEKLKKANYTPYPASYIKRGIPEFIIRQILGLDKRINYKHTDNYKA